MQMKLVLAIGIPLALMSSKTSPAPEALAVDGRNVDEIEVYYRRFTTLSYMAYTERDLIKTNDLSSRVTDVQAMRETWEALPTSCMSPPSGRHYGEDLRVLIRIHGAGRLIGAYRISKFAFTSSDFNGTCVLGDGQRKKIEAVMVHLSDRSQKQH